LFGHNVKTRRAHKFWQESREFKKIGKLGKQCVVGGILLAEFFDEVRTKGSEKKAKAR